MTDPFPYSTTDIVIVQHRWWDANTRRGVQADVTWTPITNSGNQLTPNLVDVAARGWVKTRTWTCRPDRWSGYMAVPLVATNDPDLTSLAGFAGYRVQAQGETPFTITVDHDVDEVAATVEMSQALAQLEPPVPVAPGDMVRAVWLTDLAQITPPSPPSLYYTAAQTTNLVLDTVGVHDDDPDAHPALRALIGQGGSSGGGASTASLRAQRTASSNLSGHRLVVPTSTGSVEYADRTIAGHRTRPIWLTLGAATSGSLVDLALAGTVTEPSWSWAPGPLYLGVDGQPTQTAPTVGFCAQVGYATNPTSVYLDRQPSVVLA